jgi:hypothetical protein
MLQMRPTTTDRTAADPWLAGQRDFIHHPALMRHGLGPAYVLREAVPSQCARNETGAELLIENSGE